MIREALREWLSQEGGKLEERGESLVFTKVLGERRGFLARRKVFLRVELRPDEGKRELAVKLTLEERGFGLPQETGFGSRLERYKVGRKREGTVAEELTLFASRFGFSFDFTAFQRELEKIAQNYGFATRYEL